jgi:hypothetical protein
MATKGVKFTKKHREKIANALRGRKLSELECKKRSEWMKGRVPWNKGIPLTPEQKLNLRNWHLGEKCNFWKGGITRLQVLIRGNSKYRQWRSDVFERDNYTCYKCLERGLKIHAHHVKTFSKIILENNIKTIEQALDCEELWNINNGITLCKNCHEILHNL